MTEIEIMELKKIAAEKTGVPADMISGETTEEIAASAVALSHYKKECQAAEAERKAAEKAEEEKRAAYEATPTRDKFAAWFTGEPLPDPTPTPAAYPNVPDGGTPQNIEYRRDPRDAFAEWFADISAFDPRKTYGNF